MKSIFMFFIALCFSNINAQSLWQIKVTYIPTDTSLEHLKSIILDEYSSQIDYEEAAFYIAYYYESEKQWLLDHLKTVLTTDKATPVYIMKLQKFLIDQIVKGYLGDQSAVDGLQTAIDSMTYVKHKILADRYLAEAGVYNNFNLLKNAFLDTNYRDYTHQGLRTYANSPLYKNEVISLFEQALLNASKADEVRDYARDLYWIDKDLAIELLDQKFEEFVGWNRQSLFIDLYTLDPDNQPRRSMWAIPLEQDESLRAYYIPFFPSIKSGVFPKVYLQPFWIDFLNNWYNLESSDNIKDDIIWFIHSFRPLPTEEELGLSLSDRVDKLSQQVDSIDFYTWLGDLQFKDELQNTLQSAKTNLLAGDSLTCAIDVKAFQDNVDFVYADSLNTDPRFVTIEGWKFLYWNAQYILDRLPTPPPVIEIGLTEITPVLSMANHPGAFTMELMGSGFTSNAIVYFNGNEKMTTFISENTLNAEIPESDVSAEGNFPVWVSDGTAYSDTLMSSVVNNLPNEILPVMNCVTNNGDGTYTAFFGYDNQNSAGVFIPVYAQNKISPEPWDRGQPGVFKVGVQEKVFSVTWTSGNIIWHLINNTAKAKTNSPPCQ
jgi:hypothetical protein